MSKKKMEHVLFDRDRKHKKSIPFSLVNKQGAVKKGKTK